MASRPFKVSYQAARHHLVAISNSNERRRDNCGQRKETAFIWQVRPRIASAKLLPIQLCPLAHSWFRSLSIRWLSATGVLISNDDHLTRGKVWQKGATFGKSPWSKEEQSNSIGRRQRRTEKSSQASTKWSLQKVKKATIRIDHFFSLRSWNEPFQIVHHK